MEDKVRRGKRQQAAKNNSKNNGIGWNEFITAEDHPVEEQKCVCKREKERDREKERGREGERKRE